MKRFPFGLALILIVSAGMLLLQLPTAAIAVTKDAKVYGETRPDAALVYFIGNERVDRVFCEDQLVAYFKKTWNYSFAYISPGTHRFWTSGVLLRSLAYFDLAAGQIYYMSWDFDGQMYMLSNADGEAALKKKKYVALTQEHQRKTAKQIAKEWPEYKAREADKLMPPGAESYIPPAVTENMIKIPAGTAVVAELMQNLNSRFDKADDGVLLSAAADVYVDGKQFVRKGSPVKAIIRETGKSGRRGRNGRLDVKVISVGAADGTVCPLIGQLAVVGGYRPRAAEEVALGVATGLVGLGVINNLMKGSEAFALAGDKTNVFTCRDVWIKEVRPTDETSAGALNLLNPVKAYSRERISYHAVNGGIAESVEIVFETTAEFASVQLFRAGDMEIPMPLAARKLSRVKEGLSAQFSGWDIVRFLRPYPGTKLSFRLTASDGTVVLAQGAVPMFLW
jgi:hypothetical protein